MVGKKIKNTFRLVLYFVQQRWKKTRMSADAKFQLDFLLDQIVSSYLLEIVDFGYLQSWALSSTYLQTYVFDKCF